jgi:transposase-like protein
MSIGGSHMGNQRYATEFKNEAVRQIVETGNDSYRLKHSTTQQEKTKGGKKTKSTP